MIGFRLSKYVATARANGVSDGEIRKELFNAGWEGKKIEKALTKEKSATTTTASGEEIVAPQKIKKTIIYGVVFVAVLISIALVVVFGGVKITWADKTLGIVKDYLVPPVKIETNTTPEEDKINPDTKDIYIKDKIDFIDADLDAKVLHFYQGGVETKSYEILAFGKDGSWWETPTGDYSVLNKETKHFSSIGKVWMPWSMNFYGNFFIHGWPYYEGGEPVEPGHSGGCIRLSVEDARELYQQVNKGTPVIVRETTLLSKFGSLSVQNAPAPEVSASAFLVENISTGEKYAMKNNSKVVANAPVAKLMTAVIASELIYIERSLTVESDMIVPAPTFFEPQNGEECVAFDLFYPLLMQSSDTAANIIASSLGSRYFIDVMNKKAVSLKMPNTHFESTQNLHDNNTSTLDDLARLLQYAYFKRAFIYKVTKGLPYRIYSGEHSTNLVNQNILVDDKRLVGIQQGPSADGETALSVWEVTTPSGVVPVAIVLSGSKNAEEDTKTFLNWVEKNGVLK